MHSQGLEVGWIQGVWETEVPSRETGPPLTEHRGMGSGAKPPDARYLGLYVVYTIRLSNAFSKQNKTPIKNALGLLAVNFTDILSPTIDLLPKDIFKFLQIPRLNVVEVPTHAIVQLQQLNIHSNFGCVDPAI